MELGLLQEIKLIIKSLIISSAKKMTIYELSKDFLQQEGRNIPYKKLGYPNLLVFLKSIDDVVIVMNDNITLKAVSSEKTQHLEKLVVNQKGRVGCSNIVENLSRMTLSNTGDKSHKQQKAKLPKTKKNPKFPSFAVPFDVSLPTYPIEAFPKELVLTVLLCQLIDPDEFWVTIVNKEDDQFTKLIKDMKTFYNDDVLNHNRMPEYFMQPKQLVACKYQNLWLRAEIKSVKKNNSKTIEVDLLDCEIITEIPIDQVKYLAKQHLFLPIQAIKSRLYGIKPKNQHQTKWPVEANSFFEYLIEDKCVWAKIMDVDETSTLHLILLDADEDYQLININKMLVDEGFAKANQDLCVEPNKT